MLSLGSILLGIGACCIVSVRAAAEDRSSDDPILAYKPNVVAAIAFCAAYLAAAAMLYRNAISRRDWWSLCMPIGATFQGLGFIIRVPLRSSPSSLGLYIGMDLFIVLSPACYLAFNYILFGRLAATISSQTNLSRRNENLTLIPARLMGRIFILSDVATFFIQASGGGLQTSSGTSADLGAKIFLAGIILQAISYLLFLMLAIRCHWCLGIFSPLDASGAYKTEDEALHRSAVKLFGVLYISSALIIVRSVYRVIELAQGFRGYLITHEIYFLLLDSLPLLFAISIYIPFWPTKLFPLLNNAYRPAIRVESPTALQTLPLGRRSSFTPPYDGRPLGRGESEGSKVEK